MSNETVGSTETTERPRNELNPWASSEMTEVWAIGKVASMIRLNCIVMNLYNSRTIDMAGMSTQARVRMRGRGE